MSASDWLQSVNAAVTLAALLVGAGWALLKIRKRREHFPRVDFTVDVEFVGRQLDEWLVSLNALLVNKGLVRYTMNDFTFDLRCALAGEALQEGGEAIDHQTTIPHLVKEGSWSASSWHGPDFVDPGLSARYSYITTVPARASFVLIHGYLRFSEGRTVYSHTADRLLAVPAGRPDLLPEHSAQTG